MKESYGTLSETIDGLRADGYTLDLNTGLSFIDGDEVPAGFSPENFSIDKVYRFEGVSNPDDQSVLYAISSEKYKVKGILVNGYAISSNSEIDDMISQLHTHPV